MTDALRQQQFLDVIDRDEAERRFRAALDLRPLDAETVQRYPAADVTLERIGELAVLPLERLKIPPSA